MFCSTPVIANQEFSKLHPSIARPHVENNIELRVHKKHPLTKNTRMILPVKISLEMSFLHDSGIFYHHYRGCGIIIRGASKYGVFA